MNTDHQPGAIEREVTRYWKVFAALTAGTLITVTIANVHLGILLGIAAALIVAVVKGSLVAGYFMHLLHKRKLIYGILVLTGVFVVSLVILLLWTFGDQQGTPHGIFVVPQRHVPVGHHASSPTTATPGAAHAEEPHVP